MFLASACMIGPDFKPPPAPIGNKWLEAGDRWVDTSQNASTDYQDWWTLFNDPILTKLIQIDYRQNLTLLTAGLRFSTRERNWGSRSANSIRSNSSRLEA